MIETDTTYRFTDILTISAGIARSINIKRDFTVEGDEKVAGYIPTLPVESCLKAVTDAVQPASIARVRLIFGPYGGGKSNLGLVIARLAHSGIDYPALQPVVDRIANGPNAALADHIRDRWRALEDDSRQLFLVVVLSGNEGTFHDAMLAALRGTLADAGLEDVVPDTAYGAARKRIQEWRTNPSYERAFALFDALLTREGETVDGLMRRLEKSQQAAYDLFCRLHPEVAAGARFYSDDLSRTHDVYRAVAKKLHTRGYAGIFVIWDEFGSYFEEACRQIRAKTGSPETKELQDFAEMCQQTRADQVHFLALAHRSLDEYAQRGDLSQQAMDEWKKVSGRFAPPHNLVTTGRERDSYEILGRVIEHPPDSRWQEFLASGARDYLEKQATRAMRLGLFGTWQPADLFYVARYCYPLHPATCYILPLLSGAIAQNERTLFTYTSFDEPHSMRAYMAQAAPFSASSPTVVGVDRLFDYFQQALKAERQDQWQQYLDALYEAGGTDAIPAMDRRILQVIAIWQAIRDVVGRTLTVDLCQFALALDTEADEDAFVASLGRLTQNNVLHERPSDRALLFAGRERQSIAKDLADARKRVEQRHDPVRFLREHGMHLGSALLPVVPIEPTAYHRQYKTRRTMPAHLIGVGDEGYARTLMSELATVRDQTDGLVIYLIAQDEQELAWARAFAVGALAHERVLVVVPPHALSLRQSTLQLNALIDLGTNPLYGDVRTAAGQMASDFKMTARKGLDDQLRPLLRIAHGDAHSTVYCNGKVVPAVAEYDDLEDYVSDLFARVYSKNLAIDDEHVSVRPSSKQVYGATRPTRRNVVAAILRFDDLKRSEREFLNFSPTGPESRYVRGVLKGCGYLDHQVTAWVLGHPKQGNHAAASDIYEVVSEHFFGREGQNRTIKALVQKLSSPPYGLYSPVLPILIAVAIYDRAGQLQFSHNGKATGDRDKPLPEVLVDMCYEPATYGAVNRPIGEEMRTYLGILMGAIGRKLSDQSSDPVADCGGALRVWLRDDVTAFAKRTARLSPQAAALRETAQNVDEDPFTKIVVDLPRRLGIAHYVAGETSRPADREHATEVLAAAAREIATCQTLVAEQIIEMVTTTFDVPSGSASDVFNVIARTVLHRIDEADVASVDAVRNQLWEFLSWLEKEHVDATQAFGELGLKLVNKSALTEWQDTDGERVRAKLASIQQLIDQLQAKPSPLTDEQIRFLDVLVSSLGGDSLALAAADDPLQAAATAGSRWYNELSEYAQRTTSLRQDAETFRNTIKALLGGSPRQILLTVMPQRLNIAEDIQRAGSPDVAERLRRRLKGLATLVAGAAIKIEAVMVDAVRIGFKLPEGEPESILRELTVLVEGKLADAGSTTISAVLQNFVTVIRRDDPAADILRSLAALCVGQKEDTRWTDGDVALVKEEMARLARALDALRPVRGPRHVRVALSVSGNQTVADIQYNETIEQLAADLEKLIMENLTPNSVRPEVKMLGVAKVLQRLLAQQTKR